MTLDFVLQKPLLRLLDFISSRLNKGIFIIITVTKQTTGVSAFRRGCGVRARVERYCCNSMFYLSGFIVDVGGKLEWSWGVGGGTVQHRALRSHSARSIGPNPLKSIETPHLFVHNSSEQLWKLPETSSGQYFWDSLMVQSKVHLFVCPGFQY